MDNETNDSRPTICREAQKEKTRRMEDDRAASQGETCLTCKRCGSCCVQVGYVNPSIEDVERWVWNHRFDILQYCVGWRDDCCLWNEQELMSYLTDGMNYGMWFDSETGEELLICPFLRKTRGKDTFRCLIHDTKPETCRDYICNPKDMKKIVKRPFKENLKVYKRKRRNERIILAKKKMKL